MSVAWKPSTPDAHDALPKKSVSSQDPAWDTIMDELQKGNAVMIECHSDTERSALTRSIRRRAANRGFKADIRQGDGYLSARQADESQPAKDRKPRTPRARKTLQTQSRAG